MHQSRICSYALVPGDNQSKARADLKNLHFLFFRVFLFFCFLFSRFVFFGEPYRISLYLSTAAPHTPYAHDIPTGTGMCRPAGISGTYSGGLWFFVLGPLHYKGVAAQQVRSEKRSSVFMYISIIYLVLYIKYYILSTSIIYLNKYLIIISRVSMFMILPIYWSYHTLNQTRIPFYVVMYKIHEYN